MIVNQKSKEPRLFTQEQDNTIVFTDKADVVLSIANSAITIQGSDKPAIYRTLILNNNLTIKGRIWFTSIAGIQFLSEQEKSGIISITAAKTTKIALTTSDFTNTQAYGWQSAGSLTVYGSFMRQNFNVSITSKQNDSKVAALAVSAAYDLNSRADFQGNFTVAANAGDLAYAYGIYAPDGNITLKALSGKMTVTAKLSSKNGTNASATAVESTYDNFTADWISGKITISGDTSADGFYVGKDFSVGDMSQMKLDVSAKNGTAYGIYCVGNCIIGKDGLDLGKISVSGAVRATGFYLESNTKGTAGYSCNNRLLGNITVTSNKGSAWGVDMLDLTDTIFSAAISVKAQNFAYGISTGGDLTLDGAKITAEVLDASQDAYAVFVPSTPNIPALENIIKLTGKSTLRGNIDTGKAEDTVVIESGSQLTGGLRNVENLEFIINDISQKKSAMWYGNTINGANSVAVSTEVDYGLQGDFKLISKKAKDNWGYLIDTGFLGFREDNELFTYSVFQKGNDLYLRSEINENAAGNIFTDKINVAQTLNQSAALFTSKADVKLKNERIAIDCDSCEKLVLDNNITSIYATVNSYDECTAINSSADLLAAANNVSKTLKLSNSVEFESYYLYNNKTANTSGCNVTGELTLSSKFLQNITVSAVGSRANIGVYGIKTGSLAGKADISGKFTVSGKADEELSVYGIYAQYSAAAGDISSTFNISASGMKTGSFCGIHAEKALTMDKLSGKFTLKSTGGGLYGSESICCGISAGTDLIIQNGFTGKVTITVKNLYNTDVYGIKAGESFVNQSAMVGLYGKNTGAISLTNTGTTEQSETTAIYGYSAVNLTNYSGAITVKAAGKSAITTANGISSLGSIDISGKFSSKLKVSAENASGNAYADGITLNYGDVISIQNSTASWNIAAKGYDAGAFGIYTANTGDIILGDFSGTMKVTGKSTNSNTQMESAAFFSAKAFSAENISANITVSATGKCFGFYSSNEFSVADMSKMKLNVTSQNAQAYGICIQSGNHPDMVIDKAGLNIGKITVKAKSKSYGIYVQKNIFTENNAPDNRITGTLSVTSTDSTACAITAEQFCDSNGNNEVVISADISATGKSAFGIDYWHGDLILDNAKITVKSSDKATDKAYAIHISEWGDNNIYIQNNSNITGHINTHNNNWATNDIEQDIVFIESGSKLTGALCNVEYVQLILNDSTQAKNSLWDVTECDEMTQSRLWLDIEYGMTGEFLLAVNKSDSSWNEILDFSGDCANVNLNVGDNTFTMTYGSCTYEDYNYTLKEKGNKLFLAVTEI